VVDTLQGESISLEHELACKIGNGETLIHDRRSTRALCAPLSLYVNLTLSAARNVWYVNSSASTGVEGSTVADSQATLRKAIHLFEDRLAGWNTAHPVQSDLINGLVRLEKLAT
jgi:hypothetical protein